jgi:hypothetical protein
MCSSAYDIAHITLRWVRISPLIFHRLILLTVVKDGADNDLRDRDGYWAVPSRTPRGT